MRTLSLSFSFASLIACSSAQSALDASPKGAVDAASEASPDGPGPTDTQPSGDLVVEFDRPNTMHPPCILPSGAVCLRGANCPLGDGCNTCMCFLEVPRGFACTRRACVDASTDAAFDASQPDAGDVSTPRDVSAGPCRADTDCRAFSDYCMGCHCLPLGDGEANPRCAGMTVSCFVDPCRGRSAACESGVCVIR